MSPSLSSPSQLERISSHIPGLDAVLGGGFFKSGVYIVHGLPGCGKTIFANQLCFGHIAAGGRAVYVTLLAESHARMLQHLRGLSFFDEAAIPDRLSYISAYAELEADGLKGLMAVLRREMRARQASVLVLDGLVAASETAQTDQELKKFIHEIQTNAMFHSCTVFLITSGLPLRTNAEHTMVDGLLDLEERTFDLRAERSVQLRKFRGARSLRGRHAFRISDEGIRVFPRIESLFDQPPGEPEGENALATGVPGFDALIATRGLAANSATVIVGSTGTGKTTFAMHFLAQSTPAERGLYFGFFEAPERLRSGARAYGMDFPALEASGALTLMWHSQGEHQLDELGHCLLHAVGERGIKRVVIDGLSGFFESATYTERIGRFFACLTNELRRRGVTVVMTLETRDAVGSTVPMPYGVSALVDNLIFLRFAEARGELKRLVSIIKLRCAVFNAGVHAYDINARGITVNGRYSAEGDIIPSAEAVARPGPVAGG